MPNSNCKPLYFILLESQYSAIQPTGPTYQQLLSDMAQGLIHLNLPRSIIQKKTVLHRKQSVQWKIVSTALFNNSVEDKNCYFIWRLLLGLFNLIFRISNRDLIKTKLPWS